MVFFCCLLAATTYRHDARRGMIICISFQRCLFKHVYPSKFYSIKRANVTPLFDLFEEIRE